jgi:hypothetical protein
VQLLAAQTVAFTSTAPTYATVGSGNYVPGASSTSGVPVTLGLDASSTGCAYSGGTVRFVATGTCVIDATQTGNAQFEAGQAQQSITVYPAPVAATSVSLTLLQSTAVLGRPMTFTAAVTGAGPTGNVSFSDGSTLLGTAALVGGQAVLTISTLTVGTHSITADYIGDANNGGADSSPLFVDVVTVSGAPTGLTAAATSVGTVLSWDPPASDGGASITGYDVFKATGEASPAVVSRVTATTWTDTTAMPGVTYSYTVTALNTAGSSAPSNEASATIAAAPVTGHLLTAVPGGGFLIASSAGAVSALGGAVAYGSPLASGLRLVRPITGIASTSSGHGYRLVGADGGVFNYGDAGYFGSLPGNQVAVDDIVGIMPTLDGAGYWLVGSDGGVFSFGDARFFGSLPGQGIHVHDVIGGSPTPDGAGYWLVGYDGGVFSFGDARFFGSAGDLPLQSPIVAMVPTPDGAGYWLVGSDGGVFTYGGARFYGSLGGAALSQPEIGLIPSQGGGYELVNRSGTTTIFT